MSDTRVGRQTPTNAVVLPYEDTKGGEAVLLYNVKILHHPLIYRI